MFLGYYVINRNKSEAIRMKYSKYSTIIIGSGIAGLYAALKIEQQANLPDGILLITKSISLSLVNLERLNLIDFVIEKMPGIMDKLTSISPFQDELEVLRKRKG